MENCQKILDHSKIENLKPFFYESPLLQHIINTKIVMGLSSKEEKGDSKKGREEREKRGERR